MTVLMAVLATAGNPGPAWWILAAGGAVLSVVDAQTHLLPARFTYPLAAAVGLRVGHRVDHRRRPGRAATSRGGRRHDRRDQLRIRFLSPPALGMGDVRVATLTAGLLGWTGWAALWQGQVLIALLGGLTAVGLWISTTPPPGLRFAVPMGPAIFVGSLLALWL